ncbi:hypothetical protein AGMMS4956_19690 [Bacteroidia bacterium]|nr:hypothetical protein AGMMS4956_19650 [Bacteroidia bacterium]GHT16727.1 hypothetical protein AGMMS4956_19690 [Bacteroidia bacterium]
MTKKVEIAKLRTEFGEVCIKVGASVMAATVLAIFVTRVSMISALCCLLTSVGFIVVGLIFKATTFTILKQNK